MIIESYIKSGNSFPIIINDKGKQYFVKLRVGMSGKYALINEWIGNQLGYALGLSTQTPIWIELNQALKTEHIHIEVKELVQKSFGQNIGFAYQANAIEVKRKALEEFDQKKLAEIFLFDLIMINIDRTSSNLNLMTVGDTLYAVDYESSLMVQEIIEDKNLLEDARILHCLRNNPLYAEIDETTIHEFLQRFEQVSISEILSAIPNELLSIAEANLLIQKIEERKKNHWFLKEVMYKLKNIQLETPAERRARISNNQAAFKRKFKANSKPNQGQS